MGPLQSLSPPGGRLITRAFASKVPRRQKGLARPGPAVEGARSAGCLECAALPATGAGAQPRATGMRYREGEGFFITPWAMMSWLLSPLAVQGAGPLVTPFSPGGELLQLWALAAGNLLPAPCLWRFF